MSVGLVGAGKRDFNESRNDESGTSNAPVPKAKSVTNL